MIEVIVQQDKNNREIYNFYLENEYSLWLDSYEIEHKPDEKRKWERVRFYTRIGDTRRTLPSMLIAEKDVPLSQEIIDIVFAKLREQLKVKKWSERQ